MRNSVVILSLIFLCMGSCDKTTAPNAEQPGRSGLELAFALRAWSLTQPKPFVIAFLGDTSYGSMPFEGNLVTNISVTTLPVTWQFHDSLFVDTSAAGLLEYLVGQEALGQAYEMIQGDEDYLSMVLQPLGLKLRSMYYAPETKALADSLAAWSNHHSPPQSIRSGYHPILYESANFGGYSRVWVRYEGLQNLQYLARKLPSEIVVQTTNSVHRSLTLEEVQSLLEQICPVTFHDTFFGIE